LKSNELGTIYFLIDEQGIQEFSVKNFLLSIKSLAILTYLKKCFIRTNKPVGGVKVIYQHCLALRNAGYKAEIIRLGKYEGNFFGYDINLRCIKDIGYVLNKNDLIVGTEFQPYTALKFRNAHKILFAQHWGCFDSTFSKDDKLNSFSALGYEHIIVVSDLIARKLGEKDKEITTVVTNGIDLAVFRPDAELRVKNRILALSRKNPNDLALIKDLLDKSNCEFELVIVDGLTEAELTIEYQKADIFLATGYPEGFGLPPLEAMACGCVVVGFSGGGGLEYMNDGVNSLVADDGDVMTTAKYIVDCLGSKSLKDKLRTNALNTSLIFSLDMMNKKVIEVFSNLLPSSSE
jgi:glycosyltransferase involved in cell wall biosynthesis